MSNKDVIGEDIPVLGESLASHESLTTSLSRSTSVSFICVLITLGAIIIASMVIHNTNDRYFTVSPEGVITQLVALDEALVTDEIARKFSQDFVISLYSTNYRNFRSNIEAVESMFYEASFDNFIVEFKSILEFIKKNKLYAHALVDLPVLIKKAEHNGRMKWKFELPVSIYYESPSGFKRSQRVVATIVIQRTDNRKKVGGIEVYSFVTQTRAQN